MKLNNEAVFREEKLEHILNKLSKTIPGEEDVTDCTKFLLYGYKDHKIKSTKIIKAAKRNNTSLKVKECDELQQTHTTQNLLQKRKQLKGEKETNELKYVHK